jgi:predicted RNA-binding protein with PUA-like domain
MDRRLRGVVARSPHHPDATGLRSRGAKRARMARHWLFKTEPETYSWERLRREGKTEWSGVRSFQARNNMLEMRVGDLGFFYHSSTKVPGIAGIVRVVREAYPDFTAWHRGGDYYDPRSSEKKPMWQMVDVAYEREMPRFVSLAELRTRPELAYMVLLRKGSRLSVQPVTAEEWAAVLRIADEPSPPEFR